MKLLARKSDPGLFIPAAMEPARPSAALSASVLRESFDDWLDSVAPTLLESALAWEQPGKAYRGRQPLSHNDVIRVNRATIRESIEHRHWPPEVVLSFMAVDVIKRDR